MKIVLLLWIRELGVWFHATATYMMLAVFAAGTGLIFWKVTGESIGAPFEPSNLVFGPVYFWLLVIVLTAIVAMRLFVEDRRTGMLEMIVTAPVTEWQIVLAKYAGTMTVFGVACLPLVLYSILVTLLRHQPAVSPAEFDLAPLIGGFAALVLCGAMFNAVGVLCAAALKGPTATTIAVFTLCGLWFVIDQAAFLSDQPRVAAALRAVAVAPALRDFTHGIFDSRPLVLWISSSVGCLFAAQRVLWYHRVTRNG